MPCTKLSHKKTKETAWGTLEQPRPQPESDLEYADCPDCGSTLGRRRPNCFTPYEAIASDALEQVEGIQSATLVRMREVGAL